MVEERWTFGSATVITVIGLAVMLYGVYLTDGLAVNTIMGVGGAIVVVGIAVMTWGVGQLESAHAAE